MRVFLGILEIAGYYRSLKEGLIEIGIPVNFVALDDHPFGYGGDDQPNILVRLLKSAVRRKRKSSPFFRPLWMVLQFILRVSVVCWAVFHFDVFVFGAGFSLVYLLELPFLYILRKRIFFVFHGTDARPPYLSGSTIHAGIDPQILEQKTNRLRKRLSWIERWATVISHPSYGHFHNTPFIATPFLGVPFRSEDQFRSAQKVSSPIRILHSPSNPYAKGTNIIRFTVSKLKSKGIDIDLVEIIGQPHAAVMEELRNCDFVIDQLYSDGLMPGFATEAAAFGRPVIVGGYELNRQKTWLPPYLIPPSYICEPDMLEESIEALATNPELRHRLGEQGRQFVQSYYSPMSVAKAFVCLFKNEIPKEWWFTPDHVSHIYGYGIPKEALRDYLRTYINHCGTEGLHLDDKPVLRDQIVRFANGD